MNIKELKEWVNTLPDEFNEFELVYREYGDFPDDKYYAKDIPIDGVIIDRKTHELSFMNDDSFNFYENKIKKIMIRPFNLTQRYFEFFQKEVNRIYSENNLIVEGSATWWMKTLYFACLCSVILENNNKLNYGLFNIFKNWQAYPSGPVNIESYQVFQNMATLDGDYFSDDLKCSECDLNSITNSIFDLLNNEVLRSMISNKDDLAQLSRDLYLWDISYILESKKMFIFDFNNMKIEFKKFKFVTNVLRSNENINSTENKQLFLKFLKDYNKECEKMNNELKLNNKEIKHDFFIETENGYELVSRIEYYIPRLKVKWKYTNGGTIAELINGKWYDYKGTSINEPIYEQQFLNYLNTI